MTPPVSDVVTARRAEPPAARLAAYRSRHTIDPIRVGLSTYCATDGFVVRRVRLKWWHDADEARLLELDAPKGWPR
jgi:hypothetical protein